MLGAGAVRKGSLSHSLFTRLILFGHLIAPTDVVEQFLVTVSRAIERAMNCFTTNRKNGYPHKARLENAKKDRLDQQCVDSRNQETKQLYLIVIV